MENLFADDKVTVRKFAGFVWPSVLMMVIIGLYYNIDSVFVANFVGEKALAALAIAYPVQGLMWGFAIMLAAGSSAIVAIKMGEGKQQEANEKFTLICAVAVIMGFIFLALCLAFMDPIVRFMGASDDLSGLCREYLTIMVWSFPASFLGSIFEYFIRVDGRPGFTLVLYVSGGIARVFFAFLFMGPMHMGIAGAAYGSICELTIVMLAGAAYFIFMDTKLKMVRFGIDWRFIGHCFVNGSSEMVSEASAGIVTFFFNLMLIRIIGDVGVAAMSIVMNVHYFLISLHLGYIMGVAPLISYFYGAKDYDKINVFIRYSKVFIAVMSVMGALVCLVFGKYIVMVFERPGSELFDLALQGIRLLAPAILLCGLNIFASGFFTAYGNGQISALISMSRGLVMVIIGMFILGTLFDMTGMFLTLTFAEATTMFLTVWMMARYSKKYHYKL